MGICSSCYMTAIHIPCLKEPSRLGRSVARVTFSSYEPVAPTAISSVGTQTSELPVATFRKSLDPLRNPSVAPIAGFRWIDSITAAQIVPLRSLIRLILTLCCCYPDHAYPRADGEGPRGASTRSYRICQERIRYPHMWKLYHLSRSPAQPGHVP